MNKRKNFVTIIIPCRNEEKFIGKCLGSIINNNYPKDNLEVLVVDGRSEDRTRNIIEEYVRNNPFMKLLDNPRKIVPSALNIGIKKAKGEVIVRMDAHATYERNYISKCVEYLKKYNVDNVGGTMITAPRRDTLIGRSIVHALTSHFGVGNSDFRTGISEPKFTDTVFGGCYHKELFSKIGYFDENLERSQDVEFNLRLKRAGGKTLLTPDIVAHYYVLSNFKTFFKYNFKNGFWATYPLRFVDHIPFSLRHMIPLAFILSLFGSAILAVFYLPFRWLFLVILILYFSTNIYFSAKIALKEKNLYYLCIMPVIFTILHINYGLGSLCGLIKALVYRQF